jgi:hypothetical protein
MPNRSVNEELITGFPPWCGSKFRIAEGPHFPLIQCNDCRRDEWIEFIDPRRKGLVTASRPWRNCSCFVTCDEACGNGKMVPSVRPQRK